MNAKVPENQSPLPVLGDLIQGGDIGPIVEVAEEQSGTLVKESDSISIESVDSVLFNNETEFLRKPIKSQAGRERKLNPKYFAKREQAVALLTM